MTNLNLTLPEAMRDFISEQVKKEGYLTAHDYILNLISEAQKKVEQQRLEQLLLEGLNSGTPIEVTDEWWENKRHQLVDKIKI
jgi:antitoxin ParD1/3/4